MTINLFMTLIVVLAVVVSLLTEAIKKLLDSLEVHYSSNVLVLIVSVVVGICSTALTYLFLYIPFTPPNIVCMILMAVVVWVGAMLGYDKVLQMVEQVKNIKK